ATTRMLREGAVERSSSCGLRAAGMIRTSCSSLIANPATYASGVPHEEFTRLRHDTPVAWVNEMPLWRHSDSSGGRTVEGSGYWALTRYATIARGARHTD